MSRSKKKEKCNKYRKSNERGHHLQVVDTHSYDNRVPTITPRNFNQDDLLGYLQDSSVDIVFAVGPAGTGKTLISTIAGIQSLKSQQVHKFVVTRPAVSVDEDHGFLPGTLEQKMAPWTLPVFDIFRENYHHTTIEHMIESKQIEIAPLAYMRGRTFKDSWIILDEAQNTTPDQMKMMLTRLGEGSKLVITGDVRQHDRGFEKNGLLDFIDKLWESKRIKIVEFSNHDIERHPVVKEVLSMYGED